MLYTLGKICPNLREKVIKKGAFEDLTDAMINLKVKILTKIMALQLNMPSLVIIKYMITCFID